MNLATCTLLLLAAGPTEAVTNVQAQAESTTHNVSTKQEEKTARVPLHQHPTLLSMLRRNNELRRRMGLRPQRINPLLTKAAQNHAWFMARTGSFSHYSNRGPWGRARRFGFGGQVRENIALGQGNVLSAFRSWRNSSGHWASIISDAPEVGFGYARNASGSPYWVAVYGYPTEEDRKKAAVLTAEARPAGETVSATSQQTASPAKSSAARESSAKDSTKKQQEEKPQPAAAQSSDAGVQRPTSGGSNYYRYRRGGILRRFFR
jgi:uncharacterized protein YkwD